MKIWWCAVPWLFARSTRVTFWYVQLTMGTGHHFHFHFLLRCRRMHAGEVEQIILWSYFHLIELPLCDLIPYKLYFRFTQTRAHARAHTRTPFDSMSEQLVTYQIVAPQNKILHDRETAGFTACITSCNDKDLFPCFSISGSLKTLPLVGTGWRSQNTNCWILREHPFVNLYMKQLSFWFPFSKAGTIQNI